MSDTVRGWISGRVMKWESTVWCEMIKAVIKSNHDVMARDEGAWEWLLGRPIVTINKWVYYSKYALDTTELQFGIICPKNPILVSCILKSNDRTWKKDGHFGNLKR